MRFAILALTVLSSTNAFAVVTSTADQLRVIHTRHQVAAEVSRSREVSCRQIDAQLVRNARALCEQRARADVTAMGGQPVSIVSFAATVSNSGNVQRVYDSAFETESCMTQGAQVTCDVAVLGSGGNR